MTPQKRIASSRKARNVGVLLLTSLLVVSLWMPFRRGLYDAARGVQAFRQEAALQGYRTDVTKHFTIYYTKSESAAVPLVAHLAKTAYAMESRDLQVTVRTPIPIVIEPSERAMNRSVGLPALENDLGLYWEGVVRVLGPRAWLGQGPLVNREYARSGPVPHEIGHALLNLKAQGNYPAWFNEGVAQWEDWHVTGYQWLTARNSLRGHLYSMHQLLDGFYRLPNQSLAYREGLSLVRFLRDHGRASTWTNFLQALGRGTPFPLALRAVYGYQTPFTLYSAWTKHL